MKTVSAGLLAELAKSSAKLATCLRVEQVAHDTSGPVVLAFTSHDQTLTIAGEDYVGGFTRSDVASNSDLSVDNLNIQGILAAGYFTEGDLRAGLWDFAECHLFVVNWSDLTQGTLKLRRGWLGEISSGRSTFGAEFRGLLQVLTKSIGRVDQPSCDAVLGDARCTVDLAPFTRTGTLDSVAPDQMTFFDGARIEDGPGGGIAITNITAADPAAVVTDGAHGFIEGQILQLSGIVGPATLNTVVQVHLPSTNAFFIDADATALPAYVSGGTATPTEDSGYFDGGLMTITSGANYGFSREVKAYVVGQWTIHLPFPYPLTGTESYRMVAGCDKTLATCISKFGNVLNFRGIPFLRGTDALIAVGRRT